MRVSEADVCVVGAGIVGLAHAFEARARGLTVIVLERGERAAGASVRNFGHVVVSAMSGDGVLETALRARERWRQLGARAGLTVHEAGTVVVARHEDELAAMEAIAADERRGARLVTAAEIAALAPIPTGELIGGLHATLDLRVDPRHAVAGLAALLEQDPGAEIRWSSPVHDVAEGSVAHRHGIVRAPLTIICPGPDHDWLPAALAPARAGLTRCKLQMVAVEPPENRRYGPALMTGLSLLRYPGFSSSEAAQSVRARIEAERPELLAAGVHLIVTQRGDGRLILGDTHEYGATVSPFGDERLDELVLAEARRLLGADRLEVRERWHGIYPSAPGDPFAIACPLPGVAVVEVVSGVGMTTSLGLAPQTFDALTESALPVGGGA